MLFFVVVPFERFGHHERPPKTLLLLDPCSLVRLACRSDLSALGCPDSTEASPHAPIGRRPQGSEQGARRSGRTAAQAERSSGHPTNSCFKQRTEVPASPLTCPNRNCTLGLSTRRRRQSPDFAPSRKNPAPDWMGQFPRREHSKPYLGRNDFDGKRTQDR
jgi:hypothetical protein